MSLLDITQARKDGKIIGFTCSTFDVLHAGHCAMLAEAKANCDYLVVGLLTDPTIDRPDKKSKPIQSVFERYIQVSSLSYIDEVIPFESEQDLLDMLLLLLPDIRLVGEEYEGNHHTGVGIKDIKIIYNKRKHSFSSTDKRNRIKEATT